MQPFIIRNLRSTDTHALLTFANDLIAEDTFILLSGKPMTLRQEAAYVRSTIGAMRKREKIRIVAFAGRDIVGSAEIRRGEKRKRHVGEIGISVARRWRRHGVGKTLMSELLRRAKSIGLRLVYLHCFETNSAAIAMYTKFGFVPAGRMPGIYFWRGKYVGELTMYKTL